MNILSVDWDYFFPDDTWWDWGHSENKAFFFELLWYTRAYSRHMKTGDYAIDKFIPSGYENFWQKVCPDFIEEEGVLIVAETHADISQFIDDEAVVYNFDAHHDAGYGSDVVDCGSWAKELSHYHLIYPSWRKDAKEGLFQADSVHYEIPDKLPNFDIVFVCRSSVWTPPWADGKWMEFLSFWRSKEIWEEKISSPYALKEREWNQATAESLKWEGILEARRV